MRAPAATAAARRTQPDRAPARRKPSASSARPAASRAAARRKPAVRGARRAAAPRPARTPAPRIHRRVSGPARGRARPRATPRRAPAPSPWALRTVGFVRTLPDRPLVHRLVRGQGWIVLLGFLLMGIVAMQVSLLKLNAGIGRDVERAASLQRRNGELRAEVSRLSSGERIQARAAELGMVMPPAGAVSYVRPSRGGDVPAAVGALRAGRFAPGAPTSPPPGLPADASGGEAATATGETPGTVSAGEESAATTTTTTPTTTTTTSDESAPAGSEGTQATPGAGRAGALEAAPAGSSPTGSSPAGEAATGGGTAG